jgi:hypothetical protein
MPPPEPCPAPSPLLGEGQVLMRGAFLSCDTSVRGLQRRGTDNVTTPRKNRGRAGERMRQRLCAATCLLLALCAPAVAGTEHELRESEARTGSHIKRAMASSTSLPIDKRYDQLTPEQQQTLASQYEAMGEGDEPPFPRDGLRPILRALSEAQRHLLVSGELKLVVQVNAEGRATGVSRVGPPIDDQMTSLAAKVLMLTPFKPARCKGTPCAQDYPFSIEFQVKL